MELGALFQQLARLDYLDGLGIGIGPREMSIVHLAKRFFRVSVRRAQTVPLPASGPERLHACGQALEEFLAAMETSPDQVVLCLPRHTASVSRLTVPEAARDSLESAIGYEVERLFPFPKEKIYYDYLSYPVGGEGERLGVALFCLPRSEVEDLLDVLSEFQLRPHTVTISGCAQLSALLSCAPTPGASCVLIGPEDDKLELSFIAGEQLVASHLFAGRPTAEPDALSDLLAQGVTRNLPDASPDGPPIFTWGTHARLPWTVNTGHDLSALATARFGVPLESGFSPAALPALGAAVQAVGEVTGGINVLPLDRRAQREKRLSALTLGLVSLVFVLGCAWAVGTVVQNRRTLNILTAQVETLNPEVEQTLVHQSEADLLAGHMTVLSAEQDKRVLPLLRHLSDTIPADMYLTSLRYTGGSIELSGVARTKPASELVTALEQLECITGVVPKAAFATTAQGETFTLSAEVVHPCGR